MRGASAPVVSTPSVSLRETEACVSSWSTGGAVARASALAGTDRAHELQATSGSMATTASTTSTVWEVSPTIHPTPTRLRTP